MESYISLGGTIYFERLTMFVRGNILKYTPLYEKGIKQNQNKPTETTIFIPLLICFNVRHFLAGKNRLNIEGFVYFTSASNWHRKVMLIFSFKKSNKIMFGSDFLTWF